MSHDERVLAYANKLKKVDAKLKRMAKDILSYQENDGEKVLHYDNIFEYAILAYPEAFDNELRENKDCNARWVSIQQSTDPMFKSIIDLFEGSNISQKKDALWKFLSANPRLKTTNLAKLRQRIFFTKQLPPEDLPPLAENPISALLEQEPEIPLESIELNIPKDQLDQIQKIIQNAGEEEERREEEQEEGQRSNNQE